MVTFEATIKGNKIKMTTGLPLKNAGTALLKTLNQVSRETDIFNPKFALGFGWGMFFLDKRKDENGEEFWQIQSTDFHADPLRNKTDDVTEVLIIQNMQVDTNQRAHAKPEATTFKDTILVLKEAMEAKDVYMNRSEPTKNGDSGWYFGLLNDPNEDSHTADEYITVHSHQLMKFRGEALRVLQMPVGTLAVFHENTMTALVDKDDKPLEFSTVDDRQKEAAQRAAARKAADANNAETEEDKKEE